MIDEDGLPMPPRPWEPPGPPPRRRWTFERKMWIVGALFVIAFTAATIIVLVPSKWGFG